MRQRRTFGCETSFLQWNNAPWGCIARCCVHRAPARVGYKAGLLIALGSHSSSSVWHPGSSQLQRMPATRHESCCIIGELCPVSGFAICQAKWKYRFYDMMYCCSTWMSDKWGKVLRHSCEMWTELHWLWWAAANQDALTVPQQIFLPLLMVGIKKELILREV